MRNVPPVIPWWLWLATLVTLGWLISLMAGCATEAELARQYGSGAPGYPAAIRYVSDVQSACIKAGARVAPDFTIHGCADWGGKLQARTCTVIVPPNAPDWLISHELLHCRYGNFH